MLLSHHFLSLPTVHITHRTTRQADAPLESAALSNGSSPNTTSVMMAVLKFARRIHTLLRLTLIRIKLSSAKIGKEILMPGN